MQSFLPLRAVRSVLLLLGAWTLSVYLRLAPAPLVRLLLLGAVFFAYRALLRHPLRRREAAVLAALSAAISLSLVLGYHIHMEDRYFGTVLENYITPYAVTDLLAFLAMVPALTVLFGALYRVLAPSGAALPHAAGSPPRASCRAAVFAALMACYLPYFLAYYPGIILNDTLVSISQALEMEPLVNHHPVLYTLFIRLCLRLGEALFSSRTAGYALYTLSQMAYVCACLAYLIDWCSRPLSRLAAVILTAFFGLTPYFAAYSVAGWKDPIFSVSVAALSVMLLEDALHPNEARTRRFRCAYFGLLLMVAFSRTNGIGVIAFTALCQLACAAYRRVRRQKARLRMARLSLAAMLVFFIVHGPVFSAMGVTTDKREVNSLVLQQMARVAALDGDMSQADRSFLDKLLPLERYPDVYRPCCVDLLKWDERFNTGAMQDNMYARWLSMLVKNPVTYFEAWELNTFGFWTLNVPEINLAEWNLSAGVIRNKLDPPYIANTRAQYGIEMKNLLGSDAICRFLPTDEWFIPAGWMLWGCVFLAVCLLLSGRRQLLPALAPTFGLLLPLLFFTPTCYWARYAAASHYLLPVYLYLFSAVRRAPDSPAESH